MRISAAKAAIWDDIDNRQETYSSQFRHIPNSDKSWWRHGEFTTEEEAIEDAERMRHIYRDTDRPVETRVVHAQYRIIEQKKLGYKVLKSL